tara:strand:+ start:415 stop:642 length:228 start_codon:yes stop_codon:yes gene_type:complete
MISPNWIHAICRTMISMSPEYTTNVLKWIKSAVWDAPYRVWLDIELQKIAYDREDWKNNRLYPSDDECDETPKSE